MVEVNELLMDGQLQVNTFSGGRLKTSKLYTDLLSNNRDVVNQLMAEYDLDDASFKPISEVFVP